MRSIRTFFTVALLTYVALAAPGANASTLLGPDNLGTLMTPAPAPACNFAGQVGLSGIGVVALTVAGSSSDYSYTASSTGTVTTARAYIGDINSCPGDVTTPTQMTGIWFYSLRYTGQANEYEVAAASGPHTVNEGVVNTFTGVDLAIREGEILSVAMVDVASVTSFWSDVDNDDNSYFGLLSLPIQTGISSTSVGALLGPGMQPQRILINGDFEETAPASPTPPTTQPISTPTLSLALSTPTFNTSDRVKLKSSTLFRRYLRTGFSGAQSGYGKIEAYLLRVKYSRTKGNSKKRCYKIHRPAKSVSCDTSTTNGVTMDSSGSFSIKPMGSGSRATAIRKGLNGGKRIRDGNYDLTIKAYPSAGGSAQSFTYRLNISK